MTLLTSAPHVALIAMPWPLCNRPSIQLGTLASHLNASVDDIRVSCLHPYVSVAATIGTKLYHGISQNMWVCEALYTALVFPENKESASRLIAHEQQTKRCPAFNIEALTNTLEKHLLDWIDSVDWLNFRLVGFSVCFHQFFSSLAAARQIKTKNQDIMVVMGGSAMLPGMAQPLAEIAGVDQVIVGEGELPLAELCRSFGRSTPTTVSIVSHTPDRQQMPDLRSQPVPDYHDYFSEMNQSFGKAPFIPVLPIEFSRGCWWNRCTFCNLNEQWNGYRCKDHQQMTAEVATLASRHRCLDFTFADNALPVAAAKRFFDAASQKGDHRFFAELRSEQANDLPRFAAGGLTEAQIGIEALSPSLLARMNKGVSVMDNIFAMKSALSCGITLLGNLITCFPGSTEQEVGETLAVLDFVLPYHPLTCAAFFLGHGSPVAKKPAAYGIRAISVHPKIKALVPRQYQHQLPQLVMGFRGDQLKQRKRWRAVVQRVQQWQDFHDTRDQRRPALSLRDGGDFIIIRQEMQSGEVHHHRLTGRSRLLYLHCEKPTQFSALCRQYPSMSEASIRAFFNDLVKKRLLFHESETFLALAVHSR